MIPAFNAALTIEAVVRSLLSEWGQPAATVIVVDDGSTDTTAELARGAGVTVVQLHRNQGKGAALIRGFLAAVECGATAAVTMDADGQHFAADAVRLARCDAPREALVLGTRDMRNAGAPKANQTSNKISNFFLGAFSGAPLADSQCGLRRYPLPETLQLNCRDPGFAFESEVILRARHQGWTTVEVPVSVYYPAPEERVTHFHVVRDPFRIVLRVVKTLILTRVQR